MSNNVRQMILSVMESDQNAPIGKRTLKQRKPHAKDAKRSAAARKNWKSNRAAIIAGIRKFWNSAEGKALRSKLGKYRAAHEGKELDIQAEIQAFMETQSPELGEAFEAMMAEEEDVIENVFKAAELLEEEGADEEADDEAVTEAVIRARKHHRVDPVRSRLMKQVRARNKASFAAGAKKAAKTKKANGTFKALGKFNSQHRNENDVLARAQAFLEGKELPVNEATAAVEDAILNGILKGVNDALKAACKDADLSFESSMVKEVTKEFKDISKEYGAATSFEELAAMIGEAVQAVVDNAE